MKTLAVLQSGSARHQTGWQARCLDSVRAWARRQDFEYRFIGDELFALLPADLREKTAPHAVIASDLARLLWLREVLDAGHPAALWLDADTLMLGDGPTLPEADHAVGREVWVQADGKRLRVYRKVHNAFLLFRPGNAFLPYYIHAAGTILRAHSGRHMVPQLVGPKLLTALHNIVPMPVCESAAVLSPAVIDDVLAGGGQALQRFLRDSETPGCVNLCASSVARGELDEAAMEALIDRLADDPRLLAPNA